MKIRSVTVFINPRYPVDEGKIKQAGIFVDAARTAFEAAGYSIQSFRLASIPFPHLKRFWSKEEIIEYAGQLEKIAKSVGFNYVSLGPALPQAIDNYSLIPSVLASTENVFMSGIMTTPNNKISLAAVKACAHVIHEAAPCTPDGFTNLRFSALANVSAGSPYFPASYAQQDKPIFALAMQAAPLAVEAFATAEDLEQGCAKITSTIEKHARVLEGIAEDLATRFSIPFKGIDFSLAQYPTPELSLGKAFENMGVPAVGMPGSLTAAALLADCVDRAKFKRTGFCGIFLPVLEDAILAQRAAEGHLGLTNLYLYSAVCGTGLDTVPLPGDISVESLTAILLDLAALALRLDKPLTARLMPIPGKQAGDETEFQFEYFANSRVMAANAEPLQGHLSKNYLFSLHPRPKTVG